MVSKKIQLFKDGGGTIYFDLDSNRYLRWHEMKEYVDTWDWKVDEFTIGANELTLIFLFTNDDLEPSDVE